MLTDNIISNELMFSLFSMIDELLIFIQLCEENNLLSFFTPI